MKEAESIVREQEANDEEFHELDHDERMRRKTERLA